MNHLKLESTLVGIAAFLHDIGKPIQRSGKKLGNDYSINSDNRQNLLQNEYSHIHALHTAEFLDTYFGSNKLIRKLWKESFNEDFVYVSAGHHNPDRFIGKIIAYADRLASGFDRDSYEENKNFDKNRKKGKYDYRKIPLISLLPQLTLKEKKPNKNFCYDIQELNATSIFPVKLNEFNKDEAEGKYGDLVNIFINYLENIDDTNLSLFSDALQTAFEKCFGLVPASTVTEEDDVSLFHHAKTTAAFSTALYNYLKINDLKELDLNKMGDDQRYLLIRGEFFGIQNFIFGEVKDVSKTPAKYLRGKSFYVSLLTEAAAYYILEKLSLPSFNIMINAAGMFVILAHNTEDSISQVKEIKEKINKWLYNNYFGSVSFGLTYEVASSSDFLENNFENIWLNLLQKTDLEKASKLNLQNQTALFENYYKRFENSEVCSVCGIREVIKYSKCSFCNEITDIGEKLVEATKPDECKLIVFTNKENGKIFDCIDYEFIQKPQLGTYKQNALNLLDIGLNNRFSGFKKSYINTYVPKEFLRGDLKTLSFEDLAKENEGIGAISVFKADVDNLGALFALGLKSPDSEDYRLTFSRLSTMSRMLDLFFSSYLPHLISQNDYYKNTYTVFAGGDDLFLIGPYKSTIDLAFDIEKQFRYFCGENREVTLSGGVGVFKPNTPIGFMAEVTESKIKQSKGQSNPLHKNNFSLFSGTANWQIFSNEMAKFSEIAKMNKNTFSISFLYKILNLIQLRKQKNSINSVLWIPKLKYILGKEYSSNSELKETYANYFYNQIDKNPEILESVINDHLYSKRNNTGGYHDPKK